MTEEGLQAYKALQKEEVQKEILDEGLQAPSTTIHSDLKDAQIEALAYLLIAVAIPTLEHYSTPRYNQKGNIQVAKAMKARRILKAAGF